MLKYEVKKYEIDMLYLRYGVTHRVNNQPAYVCNGWVKYMWIRYGKNRPYGG